MCDFYLAMDVMCSTSSIFHLVAISVDRFFAVTSPILYSQHRHNTSPAFIVILACWATSLAIGLPIMCGLNHRPEAEVHSLHQVSILILCAWRAIFTIIAKLMYSITMKL